MGDDAQTEHLTSPRPTPGAPDLTPSAIEKRDGRTRPELLQEIAQLRRQLTGYERAFSESNHRIANSLQLLSVLLKSQRRKLTDADLAASLGRAEARILSIAQLHRHLYKHGIDTTVDLAVFLREFQEEISASSGLECRIEAEPVELPGPLATQLVVAINELILNALKHGYDGTGGGPVVITCERDRGNDLRLIVADRGKGLPPGFDPQQTSGLGLSVVRSILQQFDGVLQAENRDGAVFTMTLPLTRT